MTLDDYYERANALAALIDAHDSSSFSNGLAYDELALPNQLTAIVRSTISYSSALESLLLSNWSNISPVETSDDQRMSFRRHVNSC